MERAAAKIFLTLGITFIGISFLLFRGAKIPLGRLPGDILIRKENFTFYFPLATSIIIGVVLTLIISFLTRK